MGAIFAPHCSFSTPSGMAISEVNPLMGGGVECRWGRQKLRLSANIWLHRVLWIGPPNAIHSAATAIWWH